LTGLAKTHNTCTMTQVSKLPATPKQAAARRGPIDASLDASLFKALSDPTRLSLLACIAKCGRGCSVTEVAECCSIDFSVVSRHLSLLAQARVLDASKEGRVMRYRVRYSELSAALRGLADAIEECCPDCCTDDGRPSCPC
jgi:ArsR family transcriptional regulator, arsenate/arsenite/antimonite-responsive transcriptional repressor